MSLLFGQAFRFEQQFFVAIHWLGYSFIIGCVLIALAIFLFALRLPPYNLDHQGRSFFILVNRDDVTAQSHTGIPVSAPDDR